MNLIIIIIIIINVISAHSETVNKPLAVRPFDVQCVVLNCVVIEGCQRSTHSCGALLTSPTPSRIFAGGRSSAVLA